MPLYHHIAAYFRDRILTGAIPAGTRLPTEFEIAKEHDVSRGTVRQALHTLVSEGIVERVQGRGTFVRAAAFTPAKETATGERRIGLILPYMRDQLVLDILIGVENAAKARGYQVSVTFSNEQVEQQMRDIARLRADRVAGLIIFPLSDVTYDESIWQLRADDKPFVLVDRYFPNLDSDYVVVDNISGGYRATEHLIILGHTRIGFAYAGADEMITTSIRDRYKGYRRALQDYGVPFDKSLVMRMPRVVLAEKTSLYEAVLQQPDRPSAFFAVNDHEVLAIIYAARRCGVQLPHDLALVGFDDLSYAEHLSPALTTVAQPRTDVGLRAGHLLVNRIEQHTGPFEHIVLPTSLVVRESCGARLRVQQRQALLDS
jgi:DNA-binding LacI/PurR family transcriptional regulator